jgi:tetratricopeptide (TPR) repeat protein
MADKKIKELSKALTENFWAVWFLVAVSLILVFNAKQDALANLLWQKYRNANWAILLDRGDADLAMQIGNFYFGDGYDLIAAGRAFQKALSIDFEMTGPRYQLSRIAFIKGDFYGALNFINEEISLRPDFKRSHYVRGLIYGYAGNLVEAEKDFKEFLAWNETSWAAHNDLAWIYFKQGKFTDVIKTARQGLKWNPGNPWLLTSLGVALLNVGESAEAKIALEQALRGAEELTAADWGKAYPGNDPKTYDIGLEAMRNAIRQNIALAGG